MANVGKLAVTLTAKTGAYNRNIKQAQGVTSTFSSRVGKMASMIKPALVAVAGLAGAGAIGYLIKRQYDAIDSTAKLADELGVSTQSLVGFQHAAALSGTSNETLTKGMQRLTRRLGEAAAGYGEGVKGLELMGLKAADLTKLSPDEAMRTVAESISQIEDPTKRAAASYALFGRQGQELMNFLMMGRRGLADAQEETDRLGASFSRVDAAKIEQANDAITRLKLGLTGFVRTAAVALAPYVTKIANMLTSAFVWARDKIGPLVSNLVSWIGNTVKRFIDFAAPIFISLYHTVRDVWIGISEAASAAWSYLSGVFDGITSMLGASGSSWAGWGQWVGGIIASLQFGFSHFIDILAIYMLRGAASVVKFGNQIAWVFTDVIPATLKFVWDKFANFFGGITRWFKNLFSNIAAIVKNSWKLVRGELTLSDVWRDLDEGMSNRVATLQIPRRVAGELEQNLTSAVQQAQIDLGSSYDQFMSDRLEGIQRSTERVAGEFASFLSPALENLTPPATAMGQHFGAVMGAATVDSFEAKLAQEIGGNIGDMVGVTSRSNSYNPPGALDRGSRDAYSAQVRSYYSAQRRYYDRIITISDKMCKALDRLVKNSEDRPPSEIVAITG